MKKWPHALLHASNSDKYDTLECMFIIMSDARNQIVVSGYVARQSRSCFAFSIVFVVPLDCLMAIELKAIRTVMSTDRA